MIFSSTLHTFVSYCTYIACVALCLILIHRICHLPQNMFRKLLHIAAFTSSIYVVLRGTDWLSDTLTLVVFALIVWPILKALEGWGGYRDLFVEKHPGEVKNSLLLLFFSQAIFVAICCGLLEKPYILITSTAAWGLGDIAAAWVGRPLGKHPIHWKFADPHKTWEGSGAMAVVSFLASFGVLALMHVYPLGHAMIASIVVACVSAVTEMCSRNGMDTVTVPAANVLILWLMSLL